MTRREARDAVFTLLYEYEVGETVTITVQRGTELLDLSIVLGERSN